MNALIAYLALAGSFLAIPQGNAPDLYAVMARVNQLAAKSLWPGFEPRSVPVAFFTGTKTLLFGHPHPPDGFLPAKGHEGVMIFAGRHESVVANTSVNLGGVLTATIMLESMTGKSTAEIAAVVVHETFHVFQTVKHGDWSSNEVLLFTYPMDEVQNHFGLLLEARALARAVRAKTNADAARWAAGHLKLRGQRYEAYPGAADYERGVELTEGTAHYVEALALGKVAATESLVLPWRPDQVRHRCYFTGKALAAILDRMDPGWKQALEAGPTKTLDVLLLESLASQEVDPARFDEAEKADLTAQAERAVTELKQYREKTVAEFRARPGARIIIETPEDNLLQVRGFDPMNILKVGEREVLHLRMLTLGCKNANLQVVGLPALSRGLGPHPLFNGILRLEIAGLAATPEINQSEGHLTVNSDTLKMDFTNASLTREGLIIRILLKAE